MKLNHRILVFGLFTAMLAFAPDVLAQSPGSSATIFMSLVGEKSGVINGEVIQKGREGQHQILAYSHEIVSPRDPATGLPTGKRQHQPFRVVKLLNQASPVLLNVLATGEVLRSVTINIWTPSPTGSELNVITYTLTNASLISIRPWSPNKSDSAAASYPPAEELAFTYQTITVAHPPTSTSAQDTWGSAN